MVGLNNTQQAQDSPTQFNNALQAVTNQALTEIIQKVCEGDMKEEENHYWGFEDDLPPKKSNQGPSQTGTSSSNNGIPEYFPQHAQYGTYLGEGKQNGKLQDSKLGGDKPKSNKTKKSKKRGTKEQSRKDSSASDKSDDDIGDSGKFGLKGRQKHLQKDLTDYYCARR